MGKPNHVTAAPPTSSQEMTAHDAEPDPYFIFFGQPWRPPCKQHWWQGKCCWPALSFCLTFFLSFVSFADSLDSLPPTSAVDCAPSLVVGPKAPPAKRKGPAVDYEDQNFLNQEMFQYLVDSARDYYAQAAQGSDEQQLHEIITDHNFAPEQVANILGPTGRYYVEESKRTPGEPFFEGRYYPNLRMVPNNFGDYPYNGMSYVPRKSPQKPQALVLGLHGLGAEDSHGGTLFGLLEILSNPKHPLYQIVVKQLMKDHLNDPQKYPASEPVVVKAEVLDLPNSGNGPPVTNKQFNTLADFKERFRRYVEELKKREGNIPVIVIARSAASGLVASVVEDYPDLIDGLVMVGPTHPDPKMGINSSLAALLLEIYQHVVRGNYAAIVWIKRLYAEMTWHRHPAKIFSKLKTLILVGANDIEVSKEAAQDYQKWARDYPNVQFRIYPQAEHDVFAIAGLVRLLKRLESARKFRDSYDNSKGGLSYIWQALTGQDPIAPSGQHFKLNLKISTSDLLSTLADNTQTMLATAQGNLAAEAAKKDGTARPTWQDEYQRVQKLNALAAQIEELQALHPEPELELLAPIFYAYYLEQPVKYHDRLFSTFKGWQKAADSGHIDKMAEKAGVLRKIMLEKPLLGKAPPFADRAALEKEMTALTDKINATYNPLQLAFPDFHRFAQEVLAHTTQEK